MGKLAFEIVYILCSERGGGEINLGIFLFFFFKKHIWWEQIVTVRIEMGELKNCKEGETCQLWGGVCARVHMHENWGQGHTVLALD